MSKEQAPQTLVFVMASEATSRVPVISNPPTIDAGTFEELADCARAKAIELKETPIAKLDEGPLNEVTQWQREILPCAALRMECLRSLSLVLKNMRPPPDNFETMRRLQRKIWKTYQATDHAGRLGIAKVHWEDCQKSWYEFALVLEEVAGRAVEEHDGSAVELFAPLAADALEVAALAGKKPEEWKHDNNRKMWLTDRRYLWEDFFPNVVRRMCEIGARGRGFRLNDEGEKQPHNFDEDGVAN